MQGAQPYGAKLVDGGTGPVVGTRRLRPVPAEQRGKRSPVPSAEDVHEWVSFDDPDEERTWVFDLTFLTSSWECIFGQGCLGVFDVPAPERNHGCCSWGAHF